MLQNTLPRMRVKNCANMPQLPCKDKIMSYTPYDFPAYPNAETRQNNNPLRDGTITPVTVPQPSNVVTQNTNPNPYTPESAYSVPGTQVFGMGKSYESWPVSQDDFHREITITLNQPLLYRSNPGTPRRESPMYRIRTPAITAPITSATFSNSGKGDVYGS